MPIFDFDRNGNVITFVSHAPIRPTDRYSGAGIYLILDRGIARAVLCQPVTRGKIGVTSVETSAAIATWTKSELQIHILGKMENP
jgi:hypothetical protein